MKIVNCFSKKLCILFTLCFLSYSTFSQTVFKPKAGISYLIQSKLLANRYIDVANSSTTPSANVLLWSLNAKNGSTNQRFKFVDAGGGFYYIESDLKERMVIDINNWGKKDGTNAHLVRRGIGTSAQKFRLINAGNGEVKIVSAMGPNLYLGVWNDNKNVVLRNGDKGVRTKFRLVPVSENTTQTYPVKWDAIYTIQSPAGGNQFLDVFGAKTKNGTPVTLYRASSTSGNFNQRFRMVKAGNGYVFLESTLKKAMVLDVQPNGQARIWAKTGAKSQLFKLLRTKDGQVKFRSASNDNLFLGIADQANKIVLRSGASGNKISFKIHEFNELEIGATKINYLGKSTRNNGMIDYRYQQIAKEINLGKVEKGKSQQPQAFLTLSSTVVLEIPLYIISLP